MRHGILAARASLAVVSLAIYGQTLGCAPAATKSDAKSQILRLDAEWSEAARKRDLERVLSFWAEDAIVYPPGSPALVGKAAIREYVTRSFQVPGFGISWTTTNVTVARAGDLAYATGTNRVTFDGPDGKPVVVEGKAVTVWRKDANAGWKCVIDIWNDVPAQKQ
jgi:uncharacterized protein (TIGR02246 family)